MTASSEHPFTIVDSLARIASRQDLTRGESRSVFDQMMRGDATPAQIGAFLLGMRMKGETAEELTGAAETMRAWVDPVRSVRSPLLDTCGTGGDQSGTYNVSTAVALVAAGAGVAVAKHGNRSVSSKSGSADVLQSMGLRMDLTAAEMGACLDEVGIAFLFAPTLHPATRHAVGPRRELKLRTLFNLLGPLTNPAGATRQLLGVFDRDGARLVAEVLSRLGTEHAWVVHGLEGLDELSITGPSVVFEVRGRGLPVQTLEIDPRALGFPAVDPAEIQGGDPSENAAWLERLLENRVTDGSRHIVVLNAAAALHVAGKVDSLEAGIVLAEDTLTSGRAAATFAQLREVSQRQ